MPTRKQKRVANAKDFAALVSTIDRADLVASVEVMAVGQVTGIHANEMTHRKALDQANAILRTEHSVGIAEK